MIQSLIVYMFTIVIMYSIANNIYKTSEIGITPSSTKYSKNCLFFILFFALVFGLRYDVGIDYFTYSDWYSTGLGYTFEKNEFFFRLLTYICTKLNLHVVLYFGVIAAIQICFYLKYFKDREDILPYAILFFFLEGSYMFCMNILRQSMAVCIWLSGLRFITQHKPYKYFLLCTVAFLFHRSAILMFILYPILCRKKDYTKNVKLQLLLYVIAIIIGSVFTNYIGQIDNLITTYTSVMGGDEDLYSSYSMDRFIEESNKDSSGTGLALMFKIALWFLIIGISGKVKKFYNSVYYNMAYNLFFVGLLINRIIPPHISTLSRPFRYFYFFQSMLNNLDMFF